MADDDAIATFFADTELGDDAIADGEPRLWCKLVRGTDIVFAVADGENVEARDLREIADRAMAALRDAVEDCDGYGCVLEEAD
jgi:hypothetical protein